MTNLSSAFSHNSTAVNISSGNQKPVEPVIRQSFAGGRTTDPSSTAPYGQRYSAPELPGSGRLVNFERTLL